MSERPILFSAPMVLALLDGRKTQIRRVLKHPRVSTFDGVEESPRYRGEWVPWSNGDPCDISFFCPYGVPGDVLWVRETFTALGYEQSQDGKITRWGGTAVKIAEADYAMMKDGAHQHRTGRFTPGLAEYGPGAFDGITWRPGIHMPRWASRINLGVTNVRVERLNEICDADVLAEGIVEKPGRIWWVDDGDPDHGFGSPRAAYAELWEAINGPGSWAANPWVWAVTFERTGLDKP